MVSQTLTWRLHAASRDYRLAVENAAHIIDCALTKGPFIISWSGGKDSTAVCHIVKSIGANTPIVVQFDDCDWPEKKPYIQAVCKAQGWIIHEVYPSFSVWEFASKYKIGFDALTDANHSLTRESFLVPLEQERQRLKCIGSFLGLRSEESRARKLNHAMRGPLYQLKNGTWHCSPLSNWRTETVFAYLVDHGIAVNPCYLKNA